MTIEEAVRILRSDVFNTNKRTHEAVLMAIEALRRHDVTDTNVGDTIYRKQAIDFVDDVPFIKEYPNMGLIWKEWLGQLPSAEPEHDKPVRLSTVCLRCGKPAVTFRTDDDIPYTNYSYCEDCLRKGLKLLKQLPSAEQPNSSEIPNNSDTVSRQQTIDALSCENPTETYINYDDAIKAIKDVPSAEPQIIHCKDCKWKDGSECLRFAEIRTFPNDFCSRAERRTDEE